MKGGGRRAKPPSAGLLTGGRRRSSPPRAARRPQPRPGHVSRPPAAAARGLAAVSGQRGSASGARGPGWGWGRGGARGEGSLGADLRSRENPPKTPPQTPDPGLWTKPGRGPESRPPAAGDPCLPGGAGRRAAGAYPWLRGTPRIAGAAPGFPGAGRAPAPLLARRHRERRLGLAAHGGDARRGWFLGEPRALPTKLQQEAKSKSQSLSPHGERHPISWERARCAQ